MKLFWKIYSAVFICFALLVMAMSAFMIRSQIVSATESLINQQKTVGSIMIDEIEREHLVDKLPFQSLKCLTEHKSFAFWWLVKPNGQVYLADDIKSIGIQAFTCFPQAPGFLGDNAVSITGKNEIVFIQTFGYGSNKMSFWLGFTTKDIQLAKTRIIFATITCACVLLVVLGLIIYFVINHLIRPIQKLTIAAGKIGGGHFDYKVDKQSNDEVGLLADAFNKMTLDLRQTTTSVDNLNSEITERKQAEEWLNRSLSLLNATLESTADGILVINQDGKVVSLNQKFLQLWHIPQSVADSNDDKILLSYVLGQLRDPKAFLAKVEQLYSEPDASSEDVIEFNDGRTFERHSQPQKLGKEIVGRVWCFRDITERKQAEEAINNLNRDLKSNVTLLTQSNRQLREFAHLAAHDLKTPLRGIAMLAQWLAHDYKGKFDEAGRRQVELLVKRVHRVNGLIDSILLYSTLARNSDEESPVDLNSLLGDVISDIKPLPNVKITIGKKLPAVVCEEKHLQKVFYNLIDNAVKFMDKPDGLITIDCTDKEDVWVFSVSDNGPGIAPRYFEKIFRFCQTLDDRDQNEDSGTGLTITRKIVELYGGQIWLTSELNHGSTFFFTLPKALSVTDNQEQILTPAFWLV
jgi:two-component system, LuxR family, sensor kinase FixL